MAGRRSNRPTVLGGVRFRMWVEAPSTDLAPWLRNYPSFCDLRKRPEIPSFLVDKKSSRNEREKMLKIGYARASSLDQNLDRQIAALRPERCGKIHREKESGKVIRNRPELGKAIDALPTKDVLVMRMGQVHAFADGWHPDHAPDPCQRGPWSRHQAPEARPPAQARRPPAARSHQTAQGW